MALIVAAERDMLSSSRMGVCGIIRAMTLPHERRSDGRYTFGAQTGNPSTVQSRGYGDTPDLSVTRSIRSETGRRSANQDAAAHFRYGVVVADGMGGLPEGSRAAAAATRTAAEYLDGGERFTVAGARDAATLADRAVTGLRDGPGHGPGATVVIAGTSTETGELVGAWLGDSRAFHVPPSGPIVALTHDHAAPDGKLTRYAGSGESPSTFSVPAHEGGLVVVCSDGVSGVLSPGRIRTETQGVAPDVATGRLVACASAAGSTDNLTAAVIAL